MADDIVNGSQNVHTTHVGDNLILIDPNKIDTKFGVEDRLVRHEDLVIYINLTARIIPRSKILVTEGSSNSEVKIDLFDGQINFLKPGGKKSLDSDWTDMFNPTVNKIIRTEDVADDGTVFISKTIENQSDFGGFGIKNIEISQNASFIPEVTINFVDVRGMTLFEQGDTNSPYTAFFHLPYPVFELTVKGYYGKAIRYQLALINFTATFDSSSGDYNVTANFIGNHVALLNDIKMQQAMIAPYLYPSLGSENARTEESTNGIGRNIMNEVYGIYKKLGLIAKDFPNLTIYELTNKVNNFTTKLSQRLTQADLSFTENQRKYQDKLNDFYEAIFGEGGWKWEYLDHSKGKPLHSTLNGNSITFFAYKLKGLIDDGTNTEEMILNAESKLEMIIEGYKQILEENETFGKNKGESSVNLVEDFKLENQRATVNQASNINTIDSKGWYVLDISPKSFGGVFQNVLKQFEKKYNEKQEEITVKLNDTFIEVLEFYPSIRNLTAVVMAGVDTYLRIMDKVHKDAYKQRKNPKRVKAVTGPDKAAFQDTKDGIKECFPWPQYYEEDIKTRELVLKYPGAAGSLSKTNAMNKVLWPEVGFIEEYTKAINFRKSEIVFPVTNQELYLGSAPISVREFPFTSKVYNPTNSKNQILWEILDRAQDFVNYVGVVGYHLFSNTKQKMVDVVLQAAENDCKNLQKAIENDYTLNEFFNSNTLDYDSLAQELFKSSPNEFLLWQGGFINTPYINDRNLTVGSINGTSSGLFDSDVVFSTLVDDGPITKYIDLYKTSKKSMEGMWDTYPYTRLNPALKSKLADGEKVTSQGFYDIDDLIIPAVSRVYATSNHHLYFTNWNWDVNKQKTFDVTKKTLSELPVIKTFTTKGNWSSYYQTKQNILQQSLTDGINNLSGLKQSVSMLNTPWFSNAIYKGVTNENTNPTGVGQYVEAAYLYINSLPITSPIEKVIKKFDSKNQYGGYSGQLIKQLAAYHELPYGFILKLGSLWWSYNSGGTPTTSVFGGLGTGDGGGTGEDGSDRCNEWFVDPGQANGLGWFDYTTVGNTLPGLNTEQQTLGLWPRLIDITHQAITGQKILPVVGSWIPVPDVQSNFTAGYTLNITKETDLHFSKEGIDYDFYTTFVDSANVGTQGISGVDPIADPYYILYPSIGGLVNSDLEYMEENISTAGFDGSARFLWAGAGYGAFDVGVPGKALKYGAIYGRVPTSNYFKKIQFNQPEQDAWNINFTDDVNNLTQYEDFTELLAIFPKQVLDKFAQEFINFSSPVNPDSKLVLGPYKDFKTIFKEMMVVQKKDVDELFPGVTTHSTQQIGETQYKNFIKTTSTFLNQYVVYKHGSVNGFDIVTTINNSPVSTLDILYKLHPGDSPWTPSSTNSYLSHMTFPEYDASLYPGGVPSLTFITLISEWIVPTLEVGVNTQFTDMTKMCFDFFVNYNIDPLLVAEFAPILKFYISYSKQSGTPNTGLSKVVFNTILISLFKDLSDSTKEYVNKFLKEAAKIDPLAKLRDKQSVNGDDRPEVIADNLKLELYQIFKTFNDKWISGIKVEGESTHYPSPTSNRVVTSYNTQFERFLFLDRRNVDIGNEAVVDIYLFAGLDSPFTAEADTSVKQNITSFVSQMCSINYFNFIPLPAYVNFYNIENNNTSQQGNALFGAFKEVDITLSSPKYICQYIGPPSTSLNIKTPTYGYNNDSFITNRTSPNPLLSPITKDTNLELNNKVVAFAVDFGIPNQQVFESISLDQTEFPNTSESFKIIEDMGKMASGSKVSTNSLNLFNLYKSRSYKCSVSAVGNALIQPTTYFELRYVPMFSGPYLIIDVSHSISPNEMKTNFTGVRVGIPTLPKVTDLLAKLKDSLLKVLPTSTSQTDNKELGLDNSNLTKKQVDRGAYNADIDKKEIEKLGIDIMDPVNLNKVVQPSLGQLYNAGRSDGDKHKGIDYSPSPEFSNTKINVVSPVGGIVKHVVSGCVPGIKTCGEGPGYAGLGNHILIERVLLEKGKSGWEAGKVSKYEFVLAHLRDEEFTSAIVDSTIKQGVKIGVMGNTGNSTGTHLHYEIRRWVIEQNLSERMQYLNPDKFSSEYLKDN